MTTSDWLGLGTLLLAAMGSAGAVWLHLTGKISGNAKELHAKIDRVMKDYVRRDDLREDIHNLKEDISRIERGQENIAAKVDGFATALLPAIADLTKAALTVAKS
jgi:hypothetical protein